MSTASHDLTERLTDRARALGFSLVGVTPADASDHMAFYRSWVERGMHGEMAYMARDDSIARRADLRGTMDDVRSVVVVAHEYGSGSGASGGASGGGGAGGGRGGDFGGSGVEAGDGERETPGGGERETGGEGEAGSGEIEAGSGEREAGGSVEAGDGDSSRAIIARYARGRDYHKVVKPKLLELLAWLDGEVEGGVSGRAYVDTGPILERDLARRAGLGWFGKNTMLINPRRGSYVFIGVLLVDVGLSPSQPFERDHCGSCRACLEGCPTGALLGRDVQGAPIIDARRCISYLTIELRGPIPTELRPAIGNRVFGCDICQEVCPFNARFAGETDEPAYAARGPGELPSGVEPLPEEEARPGEKEARPGEDVSAKTRGHFPAEPSVGGPPTHPGTQGPPLIALLETALDERRWDSFSRGSAIRRAGRAGFARNVCVGLGNWGSPEAVPVLTSALSDPEPLTRAHAAWALARVGSTEAEQALSSRLPIEGDEAVASEIRAALHCYGGTT